MTRCRSPFCITDEQGLKGREFEPPTNANGLATIWCPQCIKLGNEMHFFTTKTAEMIRTKYREYRVEDLPAAVAEMLTIFTREILKELGEEL